MKLPPLVLLSLALLAPAVSRAGDYPFKEPFTRTAAFHATGEVSVENVNGSITVRTWDKNEILIEGEKSAKTAEELKAVDLKIDMSPSAATLKVRLPKRTDGGWFGGGTLRASVRFTVTVPATAVLRKIDTVNGSVTIEAARGAVHASSVNGAVHAHDLGAGAELKTVNGEIRVSFVALPPHSGIALSTVNGGIVIALPSATGAQVHARVVNGHIDCDFPLNPGGRVSRRTLSGAIGDGRATLDASSVNGSIRIEKR
jgi:DUF4097 and DUF4098 domain-containing protein YvlB